MSVKLRIKFNGGKEDVRLFWAPVFFELRRKGVKRPLKFPVEDFDRDIKEEAGLRSCYFEIKNLQKGTYSLSVIDLHSRNRIIHEPDLELKGREVEYKFSPKFRPNFRPEFKTEFRAKSRSMPKTKSRPGMAKAPNTYAMDLIVDAPYRLENRYPYLPILVFLKDIDPGAVRIKSIELWDCNSSEENEYIPLPPDSIFEVRESDGTKVEKDGKPALLRLDVGEHYETVLTDPWYRMILLLKERLHPLQGSYLGYEDVRYFQFKVKVSYEKILDFDKEFVFRTLVPPYDLPCFADWHYGDTHYHSDFTDNPYEYGGPLSMTAETAKATGLSWVTVTDHSYCLSHPKTPEEEEQGNRWLSYKKAVKETNEKYEGVLLVAAEEITVRRYISGLHLLSFANPFVEDAHPTGFGSLTMKELFKRISENSEDPKGFLFAAHPSSDGYIWKESDYKAATDPKYSNLFLGLQIFNEKILYKRNTQLSSGSYVVDPFVLFEEKDRHRPWSEELDEGIKGHWVKRFLVPSLRKYQQKGDVRKFFILAGSDAHMDFNYALRPHLLFLIHQLNDNAFGKVRTLVYLPKQDGQALSETQLFEALRNGRTLLTDGPICFFYLQADGEDRIYRFGETVALSSGKDLKLSLKWQSTPEFGAIEEIKLFLGTKRGEKKISDQIDFRRSADGNYGLQGEINHVFSNWTESPCYLRLEAASMIDPRTKEALFRCVTNPIWILME